MKTRTSMANLQGNLTNSKIDMTDDKDMVDNKGAYQPITNIDVTNPRPKSQLSYEAVSLNQKKEGIFSSEYKITIVIPVGGWVDQLKFSTMFTACNTVLREGDTGGMFFSTQGNFNIEKYNVVCSSDTPIQDNKALFSL